MLPPAAALVVAALVVPGGEALPEEGLVRRDGGRGGQGFFGFVFSDNNSQKRTQTAHVNACA